MPGNSGTDWSRWNWLQDTYWYVRPENLPALQFTPDDNTLVCVKDQTVWYISAFWNGYFWGASSTAVVQAGKNGSQGASDVNPVCFSLLGSITPEGRVYITFIPCGTSSSRLATTGIGRAVPHQDKWTLEMQMATGSSQTTIHWAYMTQVKPDDPSWHSLPGVEISVPQILEGCEAPVVTVES